MFKIRIVIYYDDKPNRNLKLIQIQVIPAPIRASINVNIFENMIKWNYCTMFICKTLLLDAFNVPMYNGRFTKIIRYLIKLKGMSLTFKVTTV